MSLRAPFPYYGSKRKAATVIEQLHGDVNNLVIPFAGSLGHGSRYHTRRSLKLAGRGQAKVDRTAGAASPSR